MSSIEKPLVLSTIDPKTRPNWSFSNRVFQIVNGDVPFGNKIN
jgi:hypothetical protein